MSSVLVVPMVVMPPSYSANRGAVSSSILLSLGIFITRIAPDKSRISMTRDRWIARYTHSTGDVTLSRASSIVPIARSMLPARPQAP